MVDEFQSLIDCLEDGIVILDRDNRILFCNVAARRILSNPGTEYTGQLCYEALPCKPGSGMLGDRECPSCQVFATGQSVRSTYSTDTDGHLRWYDVLLSPLFAESGEVHRVVGIWRDVSEIKQIEADFLDAVRRRDADRSRLLARVIRAQEEERKRVARELHDDTIQSLTATALSVHELRSTLPFEDSQLRIRLDSLESGIGDIINGIQQVILALRPGPLDDLGLLPALKWYASMKLEPKAIVLDYSVNGSEMHLSDEQETVLFRVVQEAINNVVQHAEASRVSLSVQFTDSVLLAQVVDDGRGFDADQPLDLENGHLGLGLLGMRERLALVGGELEVESVPQAGTRLRITMPLTDDDAQETQR